MYCTERAQEGDKRGRELLKSRYLGCEQCVPTRRRLREEKERCEPGGLQLVRDIGVPDSRRDAVLPFKVVGRLCIPEATVSE